MIDAFYRFLRLKANRSWSTNEVLDIFKHRYGDAYDVALANTLMDTMRQTPRINETAADRKYEKMWDGVLYEKASV